MKFICFDKCKYAVCVYVCVLGEALGRSGCVNIVIELLYMCIVHCVISVVFRVRSYQHGRTRTTVVGEKRAQEIALYSHW